MKNIVQKIALLRIGKHCIVKKTDIVHPYPWVVATHLLISFSTSCYISQTASPLGLVASFHHQLPKMGPLRGREALPPYLWKPTQY